jgi:hypothetical protein
MSEDRSLGEGSFGALPLLREPWLCCINWCRCSCPTDVADQAATSQILLMNWISPETLGLHKMQARRRIIRMTSKEINTPQATIHRTDGLPQTIYCLVQTQLAMRQFPFVFSKTAVMIQSG